MTTAKTTRTEEISYTGDPPLTREDEQRRDELELVVEANLAAFITVGKALAEIRDRRLYRATHDSFAAYLEVRWELSRARAHQLIDSAAVVDEMSKIFDTPLPRTESHAAALKGLPAETAAEVYQQTVEATGGKVTARALRDRLPRTPSDRRKGVARARSQADRGARSGTTTWTDPVAFVQSLTGYTLGVLEAQFVTIDWARMSGEAAIAAEVKVAEMESLLHQVRTKLGQVMEEKPVAGWRPVYRFVRGSRGTSWVGYEFVVSDAIKRLSIPAMPDKDRKKKRREIPTHRLDDLCAALELAGHTVEVVDE